MTLTARVVDVDDILIRPATETGPVQLALLRFIFVCQDCRASCQCARNPTSSAPYGSARAADLYLVFAPEAVEIQLLTTIGPA